MTAQDHLKRYPKARPSTIAYLVKRDQTTDQLRKEVETARGSVLTRWLRKFWRGV